MTKASKAEADGSFVFSFIVLNQICVAYYHCHLKMFGLCK